MTKRKEISVLKVILTAAFVGAALGVTSSVVRTLKFKREPDSSLRDRGLHFPAASSRTSPSAPFVSANSRHMRLKNVERAPGPNAEAPLAGLESSTSPSTLPEYPGATARPLAERVAGQSVDLQVGWFETNDSVDEVLSFYRQKLKNAGRWAVSHRYSTRAGYVGFLEHDTGLMRLWSVLRQGSHTLVLQSSSHPKAMLEGVPETAPVVPVLAGVERPLMFEVGGAQETSKIWLAKVKQHELRGVQSAYRDALSAAGWMIENQTDMPGHATQIVARRRNGAQMIIDLRGSPDRSVSVSITLLPERA